jgi:exodeoxyribonuclease-3
MSWNVNGLRSVLKGHGGAYLCEGCYDAMCLQEVKMQEDLLTNAMFHPNPSFWNVALKPGYSGVATILNTSLSPTSVIKGIGDRGLDSEGRVLTTECESFVLINTYAPHSHRQLLRLREKERFCVLYNDFVRGLRKLGKPIIIAGDLNAAHQEIDLYHYKANQKNAGFLPVERQWISDLLSIGFVDAFRLLYPEQRQYSWWGLVHNLRERNIGWRIDYILVDTSLKNRIKNCVYLAEQHGSDHCPVVVDIDI